MGLTEETPLHTEVWGWVESNRDRLEAQEWDEEGRFLPGLVDGIYFVGQRHHGCTGEHDCPGARASPEGFLTCFPIVKIGITRDIRNRMVQLQTANPHKLFLLAIFRGKGADERELHRMFREYRVGREWYWNNDPLAELIYTIADHGGFYEPFEPECMGAEDGREDAAE